MQKFLGENLEKLLALDNVVLHSSNLKNDSKLYFDTPLNQN